MINFKHYLNEKKEERLYLDTIMEEQYLQDNISNWIVEENEDGEEILVAKFILESEDEDDDDEDGEKKESKPTKADLTGKAHELLVGYHLNGGKHMEKHVNLEGDSPEEAHTKVKDLLDKHYPGEYERSAVRAKAAADHIRSHIESKGHVIKHAVWTSKAGDIGRATNGEYPSTQNEDPSDILVQSHHKDDDKKRIKYTGISLKKTDKNSPEVPASNLGLAHSGPDAAEHLEKHRSTIRSENPDMPNTYTTAKGKVKTYGAKKRKEWFKAQPEEVTSKIKARSVNLLQSTAARLAEHLNNMPHEERQKHLIRVLGASNSPMHGKQIHPDSTDTHEHYKHITYGAGDNVQHKLIDDVKKHYENHVANPENIRAEARSGGVVFTNKIGDHYHEVARQDMKFSSQSDPASSMVSAGKEIKIKPPKPPKDPNAPKKVRAKKAPAVTSEEIRTLLKQIRESRNA